MADQLRDMFLMGGGLTSGAKALSVDQFFEYLSKVYKDADAKANYARVAWVYRCVQLRANAIARIPHRVMRGQQEVKWPIPMKRLLWMTEAALCTWGVAYWLKIGNGRRPGELQWLNPGITRAITDAERGITGFEQYSGRTPRKFQPEQIVYFRLWHTDNDLGPGISPMKVACSAAGLADKANVWAERFFENGAIPAVLLSSPQSISPEDSEKVAKMWDRMVGGLKRAFRTMVVGKGLEPKPIGSPVKDVAMPALTKSVRQQIAVAFGIPQTLLEDAANYATALEHRKSFWMETVAPQDDLIGEAIQEQLIAPMGEGLQWVSDIESIPIMQEEEEDRSAAVLNLVKAGMKLEAALEILGYDIPEGLEIGGGMPMLMPAMAGAVAPPTASYHLPAGIPRPLDGQSQSGPHPDVLGELRTWRNKVRNRGKAVGFTARWLPPPLMDMMTAGLNTMEELGLEPDLAFEFLKNQEDTRRAAEKRIKAKTELVFGQALPQVAKDIMERNAASLEAMERDLGRELGLELAVIASEEILRVAGGPGIYFDPAIINEAAVAWAGQHAGEMAKGLTESTRRAIERAVTEFLQTPGMTLEQLQWLLDPTFGPVRAQMIAETETTNAFSAATNWYQAELRSAGVDMTRYWNTMNDPDVCEHICRPLNGQSEEKWRDEYPGGPPAHVRCRCGMSLHLRG